MQGTKFTLQYSNKGKPQTHSLLLRVCVCVCVCQVTGLKWIEGEKAVVQSSEDKTLRVWDLRSCCVAQQLKPKQHVQVHMYPRVTGTLKNDNLLEPWLGCSHVVGVLNHYQVMYWELSIGRYISLRLLFSPSAKQVFCYDLHNYVKPLFLENQLYTLHIYGLLRVWFM